MDSFGINDKARRTREPEGLHVQYRTAGRHQKKGVYTEFPAAQVFPGGPHYSPFLLAVRAMAAPLKNPPICADHATPQQAPVAAITIDIVI